MVLVLCHRECLQSKCRIFVHQFDGVANVVSVTNFSIDRDLLIDPGQFWMPAERILA